MRPRLEIAVAQRTYIPLCSAMHQPCADSCLTHVFSARLSAAWASMATVIAVPHLSYGAGCDMRGHGEAVTGSVSARSQPSIECTAIAKQLQGLLPMSALGRPCSSLPLSIEGRL